MKRAIILTLATILASTTAAGATLQGTVRSSDGSGLEGTVSVLRLSSGEAGLETHETDVNGLFSIEVGQGAIAAAASAPGHASSEIDLTRGIPSSSVTFTLHPQRLIEGTLRDSRGRSVAGARIQVRDRSARRYLPIDRYSLDMTDQDGNFLIAVPAGGSGSFTAAVTAEGWVPQSTSLGPGSVGSGSVGSTGVGEGSIESIRISLESQGASLSGTVTSPSGTALRDITVLVNARVQHANTGSGPGSDTTYAFGERVRARVKTDSRGRYAISGLPPGALAVVAIKRGVRMQPQRFTTTDGESVTADFVIPD